MGVQMFGSYDEAITILENLRSGLMADDSPYYDHTGEIRGLTRAINVLQSAWEREEEQFAAHYSRINRDELNT